MKKRGEESSPHCLGNSQLSYSNGFVASSSTTSLESSAPTTEATKHLAPDPQKSNKIHKGLESVKHAINDGRAASLAKAAYSGGMTAQKSFLKAEMKTHAVKSGNGPLTVFNATRAVYKGGKQASKTWREAEQSRINGTKLKSQQ